MTATAVPVTNVVFDIGRVLIRWDPSLLYDRLLPEPGRSAWFLATILPHEWNLELDRGTSFAEGLAERIAAHPEWEREIRAWDTCWHEMVPGAIEGTVDLLENLRAKGVPTYSITNFSREKYAEARERFPFLKGFRDTVVSAHERLVKPDPAIYRVLLARNGLDPATCLFIDDVAENVEGARSVGMRGHHFLSPEGLAAELAALGLPSLTLPA